MDEEKQYVNRGYAVVANFMGETRYWNGMTYDEAQQDFLDKQHYLGQIGVKPEDIWIEYNGQKLPRMTRAEDLPDVPHELAEAIANDYHNTLTDFVKWLRSKPTDWYLIGQPDLLASAYMNGR